MGKFNKNRIKRIFKAIRKNTKYCASCGHNYNMKDSNHSHFPFCKECRGKIIYKEMRSIEKDSLFPKKENER